MHKLLSILLLLAALLPEISPLLASAQGPDSRLPRCCRRDGKHGCAMRMASVAGTEGPGWVAPPHRCPCYPVAPSSPSARDTLAAPASAAFYAGLLSHPAILVQTGCRLRVSRERQRQLRGPPTPFFA